MLTKRVQAVEVGGVERLGELPGHTSTTRRCSGPARLTTSVNASIVSSMAECCVVPRWNLVAGRLVGAEAAQAVRIISLMMFYAKGPPRSARGACDRALWSR